MDEYDIFKKGRQNYLHINKFLKEFWLYLIILIILPLIVSIISTVIYQKCPIYNGISFYIVIAIPSLFLGFTLAILSISLTKKYSFIFFFVFYALLILAPILEIYYRPQIYFYNPVIVYFPGTMYDEAIAITWEMILYRLITIMFMIVVIWSALKIRKFSINKKIIYLISLFVAIFLFFGLKPIFGFSSSESTLYKALGKKYSTKHFKIIYPSSLPGKKIKYIAFEHEYYFKEISKLLRWQPERKITSYIFKSREQKRRLFGAGNADVAKPWMNMIFLNYSDINQTVKHELAHLFSAHFGVSPFKLSADFNPALLEGFAVAVENNFDNYNIDYIAKLAYDSDYKYPIKVLFSGFKFYTQTPLISYTYAGSFIKYLMDKYGVSKLEKLYHTLNFYGIYDKDLLKLSDDYYKYLKSIHIIDNKYKAQLYFGTVPIFKKFCLRYAANQIKNARSKYNRGLFSDAMKSFKKVYYYSNSFPALMGYINSLIKLNRNRKALMLLKQNIDKYSHSAYLFSLELKLGDIFVRNNKISSADSVYNILLNQNPSKRYEAIAKLRLSLTDKILKKYVFGSPFDKYEIILKFVKSNSPYNLAEIMIELSRYLQQNYSDFISRFVNENRNKFKLSANDYFNLSVYSAENGDYSTALNFAKLSVKYLQNDANAGAYTENLNLMKWIFQHSQLMEKVK